MSKSLLKQIQTACLDQNQDVATILRLCKVLAHRVKSDELSTWVNMELDGYPSHDLLPDYRILRVPSYGHFSGLFGAMMKNMPIPPSTLPEKLRDAVETHYVTSPISVCSSLIDAGTNGSISFAWPADMTMFVGRDIYSDMNCLQAWKHVPVSSMYRILDTVRNRILDFVLKLEDKAPLAGEVIGMGEGNEGAVVTQVFNTTITGGAVNFNASGDNASMNASSTIQNGDLPELRRYLENLGVEQSDLDSLEKLVVQDRAEGKGGIANTEIQGWVNRTIAKAGQGLLKVGGSVAASLITKAFEQFFK